MKYGGYLDFGDELSRRNWHGYGYIEKKKVANCAFTKVFPGDILEIRFYRYNDDSDTHHDCGILFVKVVSISLPIPNGLIKSQKPGQVVVELPNGRKMNLFEFDHPKNGYKTFYWPTEEVLDYARNHYCLSDRWFSPGWHEHRFYVYSYRGRGADLKDAMLKAKEWQTTEKTIRERQARAAAEAARARVEDAARNAAVSRRELDDLFSKM